MNIIRQSLEECYPSWLQTCDLPFHKLQQVHSLSHCLGTRKAFCILSLLCVVVQGYGLWCHVRPHEIITVVVVVVTNEAHLPAHPPLERERQNLIMSIIALCSKRYVEISSFPQFENHTHPRKSNHLRAVTATIIKSFFTLPCRALR